MQEIPDVVFEKIESLYCDTLHAKLETGDLINPLQKGLLQEDQIRTLGQLIKSNTSLEEGLSCFKSVGMALFDLTVSKALYDRANHLGMGQILKT